MVDYLDELELGVCLQINAWSHSVSVRRIFNVISKLGDYPAYVIAAIACLPFVDVPVLEFLTHALCTAVVGLGLYKILKSHLVRERPFITHTDIICGARPLDRYSFPSGHTLHAVSFTLIFWAYVPDSAWFMAPFAALVAASRMVLGLHYPTDVIVGAVIGALVASTSLAIVI